MTQATGHDAFAFLDGESEVAGLIRDFDWRNTALGELHQWSECLRTIVATMLRSPVPMTLQWGREGWMIYNDAYRDIAGARHPGLLGKTIRDAWTEVADFRERAVHHVLAGNALSYRDEYMVLVRNGEPEDVWLDIDYSPVVDVDGMPVGVLAIVKNTTERFRTTQRLLIAQEAGGVGIFELYPDSGRLEVSDAFRRIWGVAADVPVTLELMRSLVHPDDQYIPDSQEVGLIDQLAYREYRRIDPATGETRWIAHRGKAVSLEGSSQRFAGIVMDITDRKRTEQALAESDARWRHLVEQMDIKEIRHRNVRTLVTQLGAEAERSGRRSGGMVMLAEMLDKSTAQVSRFAAEEPVTHIGNRIARQIELAFGKEHGWMDHVQWKEEQGDHATSQE